ncbi:MAG: glutathione ABC transporter ATP-binding protein [Microbacterium sp. 71-36]|uniref:ABC transporter ATP-binding protein n=1 Tax=unclassified Microbacterium TaxID=2609290 RepID=UPI00086DBA83|nr:MULTISPECIES: ABC transporter ATP-binding protein [unclassified Microbacterium]MBN9210249.1 ABC transporter ATP-binding protein [Microbacterium sp.]ODT37051.1 MAG: glutathione ABC transporter ATP-binding protein [Microbacterium sp. SCN 71-17]OJV77365.1 MAG: glutathione ABC transporter ATP-binding protein [Microbacterium sp. 71-36]SIR45118.1 peptide/nickel transport system ATP-binding protein [Microbacterium sp. RURRCA19A]
MSTTENTGVPALEMTDVSVDFAVDDVWVPAAKNLTYSIARGQVVAVVGESGSGKSVSSMAVLDLLPRNSRVRGSIKVNGREVTTLSTNQMRQLRGPEVAAIFQEPMTALNPVLTVGSQIIEALRAHTTMAPSEAKSRALELLDMVGLPDPQKAFASYPHQLSGGQRQRAMIAQSISLEPALLIADEPTTALDVTVQAEILDLIRDLRDRLDSAVLLITHDMGVVADLADWIVVMKAGEVVEQGPAARVLGDPQDAYTKELLASVPRLGETLEGEATVDVVESLAAAVASGPARTETLRLAAEAPEIAHPVLSLENVSIEYGKKGRVAAFRAVDDVTLGIAEGEIVGLVGESGSGKSTIGRAAIGLQPIADGRLIVDGVDISSGSRKLIKSLRRRVGIVFQDPSSSLNPRLPIGESIGEPLFLAGEAKGAALDARVEKLLDEVRLPRSYRNRYPHELSGGQKQRVGIARALSLQPRLLVADEPTSALDVSVQARVLELLSELQQEHRFACLFISHDLAVVDAMADRIVVLNRGKIAEQGTRDQILRAPKEPYTQRLIAAIPVPDVEVQAARRELRHELLKNTPAS